ncbi:MAG: alpha/beta hydrolase [Alcanivoracaceae bacterium]|nr:alpha/beta hydrolase [Alcanivoracaceae bacterium]
MKKLLSAILVLFVAIAAIVLATSWAPDRPLAELSERWATPPSTFIDIDGMQVHLRDQGPRNDLAPIVLIHGTSASLHTWDGWTNALADQRRVIRFDLPAFGLTGPAPDNDYSIERYADFTLKVMDALGVESAVLAGNSLGGQIAMETALQAPARAAALVLVDSGGYPFEAQSMPIGFKIAQIPAFAPLMNRLLPRSMIESSVESVYGNPSKITPELVDRYYELTLREGNRAALVKRFQNVFAREDARQRASTLSVPTLIIWGDQDRLIPPQIAEQMHEDITGSELARFAELGHVPHEEDPAVTVAATMAFLEKHQL